MSEDLIPQPLPYGSDQYSQGSYTGAVEKVEAFGYAAIGFGVCLLVAGFFAIHFARRLRLLKDKSLEP